MKTPRRNEKDKPSSAKGPEAIEESPQSKATFPLWTDVPGEAGLANEARPGLGARHNMPFPGEPPLEKPSRAPGKDEPDTVAQRQRSSREPNDRPLPREPQEQRPDSWAHEAERDTGVTGHMGAD